MRISQENPLQTPSPAIELLNTIESSDEIQGYADDIAIQIRKKDSVEAQFQLNIIAACKREPSAPSPAEEARTHSVVHK